MEAREVDSFVRKFYQLWNSGYTAHLDIDTCAGKAWVGLRLQLDHAPGGHQHQPAYHQKHFSASRQRRRERRAAAHAAHTHAEGASEESTNNEDVNIAAKEVIENVDLGIKFSKNKEVEAEEVDAEEVEAEEVEAKEVEDKEVEAKEVEEVEAEEIATEEVEAEEETPDTTAVVSVNELEKESNENNVIIDNSEVLENDKIEGVKCPDMIPVYCIATLENCPDANLDEEYGESIRRFLLSEQHLVQNVSSVDLQHLSSRSFRNNSHTHTVSVTMQTRKKIIFVREPKFGLKIVRTIQLDKFAI